MSAVLGGALREDVLATAGLDDRKSSNGYLAAAEELMADAVGADRAFFSTCGSSLSVKAAILAVTRGEGELLIGRDAHKSTVAGLRSLRPAAAVGALPLRRGAAHRASTGTGGVRADVAALPRAHPLRW
ncbi:hypothetical protein ACRAWC_22160 [Leifsonia sp. L25]|uniref:hypothetical protein n=1 Tax=Leifsonia sp. L25 TaxID=3423957 RepID=UPI003D6947D6